MYRERYHPAVPFHCLKQVNEGDLIQCLVSPPIHGNFIYRHYLLLACPLIHHEIVVKESLCFGRWKSVY